jgi:hypothetical protein
VPAVAALSLRPAGTVYLLKLPAANGITVAAQTAMTLGMTIGYG